MQSSIPVFRVQLFGDKYVGKSSLIKRAVSDEFTDQSQEIGLDFFVLLMEIFFCDIRMQLWEVIGFETYRQLPPVYYRNKDGFLIVFDLSSRASFESIEFWYREIQKHSTNPQPVIAIAGLKCDLCDKRRVDTGEARKKAEDLGITYFECSAKMGTGVTEIFSWFGKRIFETKGLEKRQSKKVIKPKSSVFTDTERILLILASLFVVYYAYTYAFRQQYYGWAQIQCISCLLYTSPSPRDGLLSRMPSSA
eukprot:TRINITY_DN1326_c0_g1_i5.p1 TRINITY_DN1326_c0_g1~~TRINITY_DN1326_c0_g1_i5.p1  ORF type:complete len:250 (+),score=9.65 TRINITY_DN1326_c0_g1_i5:65-814(+)